MRSHPFIGTAAVVLAVALLAAGLAGGVAAAGNTLRIDPATLTVAKDATFTVKVIQNATVATSGAQVTIVFDKAIVQVQSVTRGAPYANSPLFLAADAKSIEAANRNGRLQTVAAAFFPPGSVPAGDQEFLIVGFRAIACGQSNLALPVGAADALMLDGRTNTYGAPLTVTTTPGRVVVDCPGLAPAGSPTPLPAGVTPAPTAPGDVASPTPDPLASPSPSGDPLDRPSPDPAAPSGDPSAATPTPSPTRTEATTDPREDPWLSFALAALAVAAAGLALLIAIIVLAAIIAGFVGSFLLLRYLRRGSAGATAAGATAAAGPDADGPDGSEAGAAGAADAAKAADPDGGRVGGWRSGTPPTPPAAG